MIGKQEIVCTLVTIGTLLAMLIGWVFYSAMEAHTYTELTGKKVTTFQAMWVDLRVVEPAKKD